MKQLLGAILMCAAFSMLCGCTSVLLSNANEVYDNRSAKKITIAKNSFSADVYRAESTTYYELRLPNQTYYIECQLYGRMALVDTMPGNSRKVGVSAIRFVSMEEFSGMQLLLNESDVPSEVFVVTNGNDSTLSSNDNYAIYYMTKYGLKTHGPIQNKLTPEGSKALISVLRKTGYLVTVPYDIATTPIILLLNLPVVHK